MQHYAQVLNQRGYTYGRHIAPHDIQVRELGTGKSRLEIGRTLGIRFDPLPQSRLEDGINAVRMAFNRLWFDEARCERGLDCLANYRRDFNDRLGEFKSTPVHDWSSHGADALRYLILGTRDSKKATPIVYPKAWVA